MKSLIFFLLSCLIVLTPACVNKRSEAEFAKTNSRGYVLKSAEGELLPAINSMVKTSPEMGSQNLITVVSKMNPGTGTGLHFHQNGDEIFYVLEGTGTAVVDYITYSIEAGDLIFIPKNIDHKIRKTDSAGFLKVLFFMDNPALLNSFREEHKQFYVKKNLLSLETLNKISKKYGTTYKTMN